MEKLLLFQVDKTKGREIIKTYRIYTNGDIDGFDDGDGCQYQISNQFPHVCYRVGIPIFATSPNIDVRDEAEPSSKPNPT